MRILNGVLFALLVLFAAAQYNDPDKWFWVLIYGAAAVISGIAAFSPRLLSGGRGKAVLTVSMAAAIFGCLVFWPPMANWWMIDVWWPEETGEPAREGMGMMVVVLALIAAGPVLLRRT